MNALSRITDLVITSSTPEEFVHASSEVVRQNFDLLKVEFIQKFDLQAHHDHPITEESINVLYQRADGAGAYAWRLTASRERLKGMIRFSNELKTAALLMVLHLDNLILQKQTIIDGLTGVFNRAYFERRLSQEMSRSYRYHIPFSLLMLDIDRFKSFNDIYGHQTGDEVLKVVGSLLRQNTRESDLIFRYGGEEFAVLLSHTGETGAAVFADRLKNHVNATIRTAERLRETIKLSPLHKENIDIPISVSIGICTYIGGDQKSSVADIVKRADEALYRAKQMGKDRSEVVGRSEKIRVLIVDDEGDYCQTLAQYLRERGYGVDYTMSGKEALEFTHRSSYDFIFLDLQMKGMSGIETLSQLRLKSTEARVIVVSAVTDDAIKSKIARLGACEYLEKPISLHDLNEHLMARILERNAEGPAQER